MAPCGKKTTSGRLLGCVIFFPRLTYVVNRGVGGGRVAPLYGVRGNTPRNFFLDPILGWANLPMVSVHGFEHDGFRSMVLDASACINMYCNIERNIMKKSSW